jgi:hypothetical protein
MPTDIPRFCDADALTSWFTPNAIAKGLGKPEQPNLQRAPSAPTGGDGGSGEPRCRHPHGTMRKRLLQPSADLLPLRAGAAGCRGGGLAPRGMSLGDMEGGQAVTGAAGAGPCRTGRAWSVGPYCSGQCWRSFSSPRKARQITGQISCPSQSRGRHQQVVGDGNPSRKSCQRAPLRSIHKMRSSTVRSSAHGSPPRGCRDRRGSKGRIFSHWESEFEKEAGIEIQRIPWRLVRADAASPPSYPLARRHFHGAFHLAALGAERRAPIRGSLPVNENI